MSRTEIFIETQDPRNFYSYIQSQESIKKHVPTKQILKPRVKKQNIEIQEIEGSTLERGKENPRNIQEDVGRFPG